MEAASKRLFAAFRLKDDWLDRIASLRNNLPDWEEMRWVPRRSLHMTLVFMGKVDGGDLPAVMDHLHKLAARHTSFSLQPMALGPGPNRRRPRLYWFLFHPSTHFEEMVYDFQESLCRFSPECDKWEKQRNQAGFSPKPHITLGRFRKGNPPAGPFPRLEPEGEAILQIKEFELWESVLKPTGAEYHALRSWTLG